MNGAGGRSSSESSRRRSLASGAGRAGSMMPLDRIWKLVSSVPDYQTYQDHCEILIQELRAAPEQRQVVEQRVREIVSSLEGKVAKLEEAVGTIYDPEARNSGSELSPALNPLLEQFDEIRGLLKLHVKYGPSHLGLPARELLVKVDGWDSELTKMVSRSCFPNRVAVEAEELPE